MFVTMMNLKTYLLQINQHINWLIKNRVVRFLITGTINTALTFTLYILLKKIFSYQLAYFLSYISGILFTYVMSSLFIFKSPISLYTFLRFPLVYVAQYIFGALTLELLVGIFGMHEDFAPLFVIILTLPLTYVLSRYILIKNQSE